MKMKIELTADELQNVVDAVMDEAMARDYDCDYEEIATDMLHIVDAALSAMGIEIIEEDFEDEDDWDDEEEDEDDDEEDMESIIYDCDGHRGISADDARLLMKCVAKVMQKQFGCSLPEEVVEFLIKKETLRIAAEWGIEVVDVGDE